jgi:hypothetical protein
MTPLGRQTVSFRGFTLYGLSEPHTGTTAVLVDQTQFGFVLAKAFSFLRRAEPH